MSNPGVVQLVIANIGHETLCVEDNIGESIHIHYGNIRIDMTISEFYDFVDSLIKIFEKMVNVQEFLAKEYDPLFLSVSSHLLLELQDIRYISVFLEDLKVEDVKDDMNLIPLADSCVIKALNGDTTSNNMRYQINYKNETNEERVKNIFSSVKQYGYNPKRYGNYIVLIDDGDYIIDGCHRASSLLYLYGNQKIPVAMWYTRNRRYNDHKYLKIMSSSASRKQISLRRKLVSLLLQNDLKNKHIIIKGAGQHTKRLLPILRDCQINIIGIVGKDVESRMTYEGIPVIKEKDISTIDADVILLSSYLYRKEMRDELLYLSNKFEIYDIYENGIDEEIL